MSTVSEENRTIARTVAAAFGGEPSVTRFWDASESSSVALLESADRPTEGVTSYSTIGLSDHPLILNGSEYPARLEIVGAAPSADELFANAVTTAAFFIINDQWFCQPGAVFPDIVGNYYPDSTMQHLLFVPPFLWGDEPTTLQLPTKTVAWLLAVPISTNEKQYAAENGSEALEDLFEQAQIDIFDLNREPVVAG